MAKTWGGDNDERMKSPKKKRSRKEKKKDKERKKKEDKEREEKEKARTAKTFAEAAKTNSVMKSGGYAAGGGAAEKAKEKKREEMAVCRVTISQAQNFSLVLPCGQYSGQLWAVDMKRGLAC